jgi:hypothetical protein
MKIIDFLTKKPARFFLVSAILWFGLMCWLNSKDGSDFAWHDILVEANGMTFDLLVFGVLLSVYESLRDKKDKIERLQEELDDYRYFWKGQEAALRTAGAIKRLSKLGVTEIDLSGCFLENVNLKEVNLSGAILKNVNFTGVYLGSVNFTGAKCIMDVNFTKAKLTGANLEGADIGCANFSYADLSWAMLEGARVGKDWFSRLNWFRVVGRERIIDTYVIDKDGYLRYKKKPY